MIDLKQGYDLIDISVKYQSQSWYWEEIRDYGGVKLRANIRRNAFEEQSHANIEQFSDQKGWLVIASHPINKYSVSKISYVHEMTDDNRDLFKDCANKLFKLGEAFIGFKRKS
jgi:hypothetical protein